MIKNKQKFLEKVERQVKSTITKFNLIPKKDKIIVAASGGKDSTVLLYILNKLGYKVEALTINAYIGDYSKKSLENLKKICEKYHIKLHEVSFKREFGYSLCYLRSLLNSKGMKLKSCTICGVLRRYLVNKYSRKLKATKVVLGHNLDDESQVILMNLFRGDVGISARLGPITGIINDKKFVQRVKPLYLTTEQDITNYSNLMEFPVKYGECPCSTDSYRRSMKRVLADYEKHDKQIRKKIVGSFLNSLPAMKKYYKTERVPNCCNKCGEPARGIICRTCQIIEALA